MSNSLDLSWIVGRLDRAPVALEELVRQAADPRQFGLLILLGAAGILIALTRSQHALAVLAAGFATVSFGGLTWIYLLSPNDLSTYLESNSSRVVTSTVFGLAALAPLLWEMTSDTNSNSCAVRGNGRTPCTVDQ